MIARPAFALLLFAAALLTAPISNVSVQTPRDSAQPISAIHDHWARDWKTNNVQDLRSLYAPDAVFLPAVGQRIDGRDAITNYLGKLIESGSSHSLMFFSDSGGVQAFGSLAYDSGFIQYWLKGKDGPVKGFYVTLLNRDAQGKWVIVRQAFTELSTVYSSPAD